MIGDVLLTKRAAGLSPRYAMIATNPRISLAERVEAARCADALEVVLSNPERRADVAHKAPDALDQFCKRLLLRPECFRAGVSYDFEVRAEKRAKCFFVEGQNGAPDGKPELSEAEDQAIREAAIMALGKSNATLRAIHERCPRRMVLLCFDRQPPSPYDEGILTHGLLNLARDYGMLDEGINRDKPI